MGNRQPSHGLASAEKLAEQIPANEEALIHHLREVSRRIGVERIDTLQRADQILSVAEAGVEAAMETYGAELVIAVLRVQRQIAQVLNPEAEPPNIPIPEMVASVSASDGSKKRSPREKKPPVVAHEEAQAAEPAKRKNKMRTATRKLEIVAEVCAARDTGVRGAAAAVLRQWNVPNSLERQWEQNRQMLQQQADAEQAAAAAPLEKKKRTRRTIPDDFKHAFCIAYRYADAQGERGAKAKLAKAFKLSPALVYRWMQEFEEGEEPAIPGVRAGKFPVSVRRAAATLWNRFDEVGGVRGGKRLIAKALDFTAGVVGQWEKSVGPIRIPEEGGQEGEPEPPLTPRAALEQMIVIIDAQEQLLAHTAMPDVLRPHVTLVRQFINQVLAMHAAFFDGKPPAPMASPSFAPPTTADEAFSALRANIGRLEELLPRTPAPDLIRPAIESFRRAIDQLMPQRAVQPVEPVAQVPEQPMREAVVPNAVATSVPQIQETREVHEDAAPPPAQADVVAAPVPTSAPVPEHTQYDVLRHVLEEVYCSLNTEAPKQKRQRLSAACDYSEMIDVERDDRREAARRFAAADEFRSHFPHAKKYRRLHQSLGGKITYPQFEGAAYEIARVSQLRIRQAISDLNIPKHVRAWIPVLLREGREHLEQIIFSYDPKPKKNAKPSFGTYVKKSLEQLFVQRMQQPYEGSTDREG